MVIDLDTEQRKTKSGDSPRELPKRSEMAMYIEMSFALVAFLGLLALVAWIWYSANHDWASSIQRFREMI
jgi:hypothetical protein